MNKSLMQMLEEAGYPREEMFNHESDLYIFVTPLTKRVLEDWCEANGWDKRRLIGDDMMCSIFKDNITGRPMYDVAFQYIPWWEEKLNKEVTTHENQQSS